MNREYISSETMAWVLYLYCMYSVFYSILTFVLVFVAIRIRNYNGNLSGLGVALELQWKLKPFQWARLNNACNAM